MPFLKSFFRSFFFTLGFVLIFMAMGFLVVFDLTKPAIKYDEEQNGYEQVALGPRPRHVFCKPTYEGVHYDGSEWPFRVYAPLCSAWRDLAGYVPPVDETG